MWSIGKKAREERRVLKLRKELLGDIAQSSGDPVGNREAAWSWMLGRIGYFVAQGMDRWERLPLDKNALLYLTDIYSRQVDAYLGAARESFAIQMLCNELYQTGSYDRAHAIGLPYYAWLVRNPQKWNAGQLCFQGDEEAALYLLHNPRALRPPLAGDNFTSFLVLFAEIQAALWVRTTDTAMERYHKDIATGALDIAQRISPYNSSVWAMRARLCPDDRAAFRAYMDRALEYCTAEGDRYGLGGYYGQLAMEYAASSDQEDLAVAAALCRASRTHGGNPLAAEFTVGKRAPERLYAAQNADPSAVLARVGIQVGMSDTVLRAVRLIPHRS